jgi:hypothetical protein
MTDPRSALEKYLSMRKGLGYKYEQQTRPLGHFCALHGDAQGQDHHDETCDGMGDAAA